MTEALIYLATLALFSFVVVGAALVRHEMLILVSIPPVFVALITGFIMALYAQDTLDCYRSARRCCWPCCPPFGWAGDSPPATC